MFEKINCLLDRIKYWLEVTDYSPIQQNALNTVNTKHDLPQGVNTVGDSAYIVAIVKNTFNAILHYSRHSLFTLFRLVLARNRNKNSVTHVGKNEFAMISYLKMLT